MNDSYYHLSQVQRELDDMERGAASMDRQMDKLIYENRTLKTEIDELKLEIVRLQGATLVGANPADVVELWRLRDAAVALREWWGDDPIGSAHRPLFAAVDALTDIDG